MRSHFQSYLLVLIQFAVIGILAVGGPIFPALPYLLLEILGIAIGLWAIQAMGMRNLKITPLPKLNARLVLHGPYQFIRHPMYTSVFLITLSWLLASFTLVRFVLWIILAIDLHLKLLYEERLLSQKFERYASYRSRTWRIIPYVY